MDNIDRRDFLKRLLLVTGGIGLASMGVFELLTNNEKNPHKSKQELKPLDERQKVLAEKLKENYELLRPKGKEYKDKQMVVDYSHHQDSENIDPEKLELSPWFFIAKATEITLTSGGRNGVDETFAQVRNIDNKPIGGYMYLDRWRDDIEDQCKLYIKNVWLKEGDFRPIIDVENDTRGGGISHKNSKTVLLNFNKASEILEKHYGVKPILYTNESIYKNFFRGKIEKDTPLWIANYNGSRDTSLSEIDMWQCSQHSKVDMYKKGEFDTDVDVILKKERLFMDHDVGKPKDHDNKKNESENHDNKKSENSDKKTTSENIKSFSYKEDNNTYTIYEYTFKHDGSDIGAAKKLIQQKHGNNIPLASFITVRKTGDKWEVVSEHLIKDKYNKGDNVHFKVKK